VTTFDVSTPKYPGLTAIIDDDDLPIVMDGGPRWVAMKAKRTFYVVRRVGGRKGHFEFLHRKLLGLTDPRIKGDHRDGNGLDNRRQNLRRATHRQNAQNVRAHKDGSSRFVGVSWDSQRGKWTAAICRNGKRYSLGRFDLEQEAALARDVAAIAEYGEFARLNFPR
jgi:hypothetical protein